MVLLYYSPPHTLSTAFSIKKVLDESVKIILLNLYLRVLIFSIICVMELGIIQKALLQTEGR